jgi:hypothetical protein
VGDVRVGNLLPVLMGLNKLRGSLPSRLLATIVNSSGQLALESCSRREGRRFRSLSTVTTGVVFAVPILVVGLPALTVHAVSLAEATSLSGNQFAPLIGKTASATSLLVQPVDIVIAIDESGSILPAEMTEEQQAARLIALGEFAPDSRVAVIGFAGADQMDSSSNPQVPVDQVCPLTEVNTAASRQGLSDCIGQLHVRTEAEGWNTDFVSALNQAISDLANSGDTSRPRLVFMLTDGMLDVRTDPNYSGTPQDRQAAAQQNLVGNTLPTARRDGVEIWPLGFGNQVDLGQLSQIAAGGAQGSCSTLPNAEPHAVTVTSAAVAETTLRQIYADARCLGLKPGTSAPIAGGQSVNLYVTVPVIATDGAIEVIRQDPRVQVTFFDPQGHQVPIEGSYDGSTFQVGGANGPVESLTVTDPLPGVWRVHLSAPTGVASAVVNASVLWQGILRSDIVVDPPQPKPGQQVTVTVRLQVRGQVIADPTALAGVTVHVQVAGAGFATPASVSLNDNGLLPDLKAGDGLYTGYLTVPKTAAGVLTFAGVVTGQGVVGDERLFTTSVQSPLALSAQINLPASTIRPGRQVAGTISFSNPTGVSHTVRMLLSDTPNGVTVSPATISIPAASGITMVPFTMLFRTYAPLGPVSGTLQAVDVSNRADVYAQTFIYVTLAIPPHWWQHWWVWVVAALAVLVILLVSVTRAYAWRKKRDMEDIEIVLYRADRETDTLQAPEGCGRRFAFSIDLSRPSLPRLEADVTEVGEYVARRWIDNRSGGGLTLIMPGGEKHQLSQEGPPVELGDGISLGFRDLRLSGDLTEPAEWPTADNDGRLDVGNGHHRWWRRRDEAMLTPPDGEGQSLTPADFEGE